MSKIPQFVAALSIAWLILSCPASAAAQDIVATLRVDASCPGVVEVDGRFLKPRKPPGDDRLEFLNSYAGITGLGKRILSLKGGIDTLDRDYFDHVDGIFGGGRKILRWTASVNLAPLGERAAVVHLSHLDGERGVLMLDDVLPQYSGKTARIRLDLPPGWAIYTSEKQVSLNEFEVSNIERAVFYIGRGWRQHNVQAEGLTMRILIASDWHFTDEDAVKAAGEIFRSNLKVLGPLAMQPIIALTKFPASVPLGNWEAGVRGGNITLASSDMPFKSQSIQRLHEQFRHEIFHLWIPGGLNLSGNYDWFYEGFAMYQSLKLAVRESRIRFDDYLDTLTRALSIDRFNERRTSLIGSSRQRWSGANTQVYARGMLVALLTDLAILDASKGKRSVEDFLRDVYMAHRPPAAVLDGNAALLERFRLAKELTPFAERYISGAEQMELTSFLKLAGLEISGTGRTATITVTAKPTGPQKALLDKLGYNNWRRLTR